VLTATYKQQAATCEVVETPEGTRYRLADGREFTSPSAAGSAVMGGVSCNGWRFWSLESAGTRGSDAVEAPKARPQPARRRKPRVSGQISRIANQNSVPEGYVRWFCSACQKGFLMEGEGVPDSCPEGHPREPHDDDGWAPAEKPSPSADAPQ